MDFSKHVLNEYSENISTWLSLGIIRLIKIKGMLWVYKSLILAIEAVPYGSIIHSCSQFKE